MRVVSVRVSVLAVDEVAGELVPRRSEPVELTAENCDRWAELRAIVEAMTDAP